jgi:hypothetical protein
MSAQHTPGREGHAIADHLVALRKAARAERKVHGRVLPATERRIQDAMAAALAYLVCDDARERAAIAKATGSAS